jgi:hypothetical protein
LAVMSSVSTSTAPVFEPGDDALGHLGWRHLRHRDG